MQHVLAIVLVRQVDVVEEEGEVHEEPLGEVEVDGGALEEAHVEHGLPHAAPVLHVPAVLGVQLKCYLATRALNHKSYFCVLYIRHRTLRAWRAC